MPKKSKKEVKTRRNPKVKVVVPEDAEGYSMDKAADNAPGGGPEVNDDSPLIPTREAGGTERPDVERTVADERPDVDTERPVADGEDAPEEKPDAEVSRADDWAEAATGGNWGESNDWNGWGESTTGGMEKTEDVEMEKTEDVEMEKTEGLEMEKTEDVEMAKTEDLENKVKTEDVKVEEREAAEDVGMAEVEEKVEDMKPDIPKVDGEVDILAEADSGQTTDKEDIGQKETNVDGQALDKCGKEAIAGVEKENKESEKMEAQVECKTEPTDSDWKAGNDWKTEEKGEKSDLKSEEKGEKNDWKAGNDWKTEEKGEKSDWKSEEKGEKNDWKAGNDWKTEEKGDKNDWKAGNDWKTEEKGGKNDSTENATEEDDQKADQKDDWKTNEWKEDKDDEDSDDHVDMEEDEDGDVVELYTKHFKYEDAANALWDKKEALEEAVSSVEVKLKKNSVTARGPIEAVTLLEAYLKATQMSASGEKVSRAVFSPIIDMDQCLIRRYRTDDASKFNVENLLKMSKKIKPHVLIFELEDEHTDEKAPADTPSSGSTKKLQENEWKKDDSNDWNQDWKANSWDKTETETYATIAVCSVDPVLKWMIYLVWLRFYEMDHPGNVRESFENVNVALDDYAYILDAADSAGRAIGKGGDLIKRIERIFGDKGHAKFLGEKGVSVAFCVGDSVPAREAVTAFLQSLLADFPPKDGESRKLDAELAKKMKIVPHETLLLDQIIPTKNVETNVDGVFVYHVKHSAEDDTDWSKVEASCAIEFRGSYAVENDYDDWEEGAFIETAVREEDGFPMLKVEHKVENTEVLCKYCDVRLMKQHILIFGENAQVRRKALDLCKEYAEDPSKFASWGGGNAWEKKDSNSWGKKEGNDWWKKDDSGWKRKAESRGKSWQDGEQSEWKKAKW